MTTVLQYQAVNRLLVVLPIWVGDIVMATPTLSALRKLYPQAHITALVREPVRPVIDACPWVDRIVTIRKPRKGHTDLRRGIFALARRLGAAHFDAVVILPNSFRTALLMRLASIPRRIGYDRDGRGSLLTDRLLPRRDAGRFLPVPTRDYYLAIARYLGAVDPDPTMRLFTRPEHDARVVDQLRQAGFDPQAGKPLLLLNPGANFGDAKMWYPDRFAAVADLAFDQFGTIAAVSGAPKERAIIDKVIAAAKHPIIDLPRLGIDLTLLKSVLRHAKVMVTNDTGPRHMAAAMGVPVVTIFGPTDPAWTDIGFHLERQVSVPVFCGPCQKKKCPLDHRCMTQITPEMVLQPTTQLLHLTLGVSDTPESKRA